MLGNVALNLLKLHDSNAVFNVCKPFFGEGKVADGSRLKFAVRSKEIQEIFVSKLHGHEDRDMYASLV